MEGVTNNDMISDESMKQCKLIWFVLFCFAFCVHMQLFRTMLHKRMNARPSNAAASSSRKYYLEDKPGEKMQREHLHDDEDDDENAEDIFKWDKTDSDCK